MLCICTTSRGDISGKSICPQDQFVQVQDSDLQTLQCMVKPCLVFVYPHAEVSTTCCRNPLGKQQHACVALRRASNFLGSCLSEHLFLASSHAQHLSALSHTHAIHASLGPTMRKCAAGMQFSLSMQSTIYMQPPARLLSTSFSPLLSTQLCQALARYQIRPMSSGGANTTSRHGNMSRAPTPPTSL